MKRLRILITCEMLDRRGGSELYVRDVARAMLRAGHAPVVYASRPGAVAAEIRNLTVPVLSRLDGVSFAPDLVYGQHHLPTMAALLRFPGVPAAYVCHDWYGLNAFAPRFPRVLRFVAVDEPCRDRLVAEDGVEESRVRLLPNSVDLERFRPRPPLPERPRRALVFGNYTRENPHLAALRAVCAKLGVELDAVGEQMRNAVARPEELLKDYDVVFAKGRAALEAAAVGAAVVVYSGVRYLGPLVRAEEVERLLPLNFGVRLMGDALSPEELAARAEVELRRYDAADAARASALVRASAGQAGAMQAVLELCEEVVAEYEETKAGLDPRLEGAAAAEYLERLGAHLEAARRGAEGSAAARLSGRLNRYPRAARLLRRLGRVLVR
jgi:glycosyltransferase involved in cell wall biosynthesis